MGDDLSASLFMNLPIELRLDIYERVFNASLDKIPEHNSLNHLAMRQEMLRTLHVNYIIREESKELIIKLANRHIDDLEAYLMANEVSNDEVPNLAELGPAMQVGSRILTYLRFVDHLGTIYDTMALGANKTDALYGFLKTMRAPREGRAYCQRFRRFHRALKPNRRMLEFHG